MKFTPLTSISTTALLSQLFNCGTNRNHIFRGSLVYSERHYSKETIPNEGVIVIVSMSKTGVLDLYSFFSPSFFFIFFVYILCI